jgi:hypothetical protein
MVEISPGGRGAEQFVRLGLVLTHRRHREIAILRSTCVCSAD